MKLGLQDPIPGVNLPKLRLATYLNHGQLPPIPTEFGHYQLIENWQMLGNDDWGDCAFAGGAHINMLIDTETGVPQNFTTESVLADYGKLTGFDPNAGPSGDNSTDQGTNIDDLCKFWRNTGFTDADGNVHKIVAYADLNPGDLRELWVATIIGQGAGMGFALPDTAQEQFANGQPWDVVRGAQIIGGHFVPNFGRANNMGVGVSWGAPVPFTNRFYTTYNNQGVVVFSEESIKAGKDIDGFDAQLLMSDVSEVTTEAGAWHPQEPGQFNPDPYPEPV